MSYAATIYVDAAGQQYGARDTDQRGTRAIHRTVDGRPVACAGTWYGCQMDYRPFKAAITAAQAVAAATTRSMK